MGEWAGVCKRGGRFEGVMEVFGELRLVKEMKT